MTGDEGRIIFYVMLKEFNILSLVSGKPLKDFEHINDMTRGFG